MEEILRLLSKERSERALKDSEEPLSPSGWTPLHGKGEPGLQPFLPNENVKSGVAAVDIDGVGLIGAGLGARRDH